ncbi:MAG: hypothetical protein IK990_07495 [Ruminiclostridium sp.]|nr:hypothetical protein [Ruminiclostridium sp.]
MAINVNSLISAASRKLGVPEEALRRAVNDGNVAELRSYLSEADKAKIDSTLRDRKLTEQLQKKYTAGK